MRMIPILFITCGMFILQAEEVNIDRSLIETACTLDQDTYVELHPKQKTEYAHNLAHALHNGHVTREQVMTRANKSLCHDVSRSCYLLHGSMVDLDAGTVAFPLRTLLQHNRLNRTVNERGELDLSNLHIADFDGIEEVPNIHAVRSLNLSHNEISLLHPNNFKALTALQHLDLSFNKISIIRPNTLKNLTQLRTLNLSHNYMTHLDRDGFRGLTTLKKLSLSCNRLEWLGLDAFHSLENLTKLDLSNNKLQLISPGILKPLTNLTSLNISHNNFTIIHSHTLYPLRHLEYLDASNNRITRITDDTLYGLKHLQTINLKNNHIAIVDLTIPHALPNLHTIILGNNPIKNQRLAALQKQLPNAKILKNNPKPSSLHIMPATVPTLSQPSTHTTPKHHRTGRVKSADA